MVEIDERLSTYIDRIERLEVQFSDRDIVLSTSLRNEILVSGDDEDTRKEPVLYRLYGHYMFYVVTVPPGKRIRRHQHDETIFRFIAQGGLSLNSNDENYDVRAGTWFVVKANTPYEIRTDEGYLALAAYTSTCQTDRGPRGSHLLEE